MLKQRLITAIFLIPLVVLAILKLPTSIFQWLIAGVTILAALEWFKIVGITSAMQTMASTVLLVVLAILALLYLPSTTLLIFASGVWLLASIIVIRYAHRLLPENLTKLFAKKWFGVAVAIAVLLPFWLSVCILHSSSLLGPQQLLYVLVAVWLADTGGYFAGKRWGKQPLARTISPNKTWQGVYGALVLAGLWAMLAYLMGINGNLSLLSWLGLTVITVLVSVIGDLFESVFKRCHKVKDSGNLLPGHGGMLDRIDSLMAAVPIFVVVLNVLGAI